MAQPAQVTSIEALDSFRASLIVFLSKARPCLEDISDEVRRTRDWLQNDRQSHWRNEVRRRRRELEQAQQEIFSAKLSSFQKPTTAQQWAVSRAQRALNEAEDKLRLVQKWNREFANLAEPLLKQLDQSHTFLTQEMARAAASLAQTVTALEAYIQAAPTRATVSPAPPPCSSEALDENKESP